MLMALKDGFNPIFTITPAVAGNLMRIEAVKQAIQTQGPACHVFPRAR